MPPRDPALPEGTDHIIQGAAQTDGGTGGGAGGRAVGAEPTGGGGSSSGFVASAGGGDDTGGTAAATGGSAGGGSLATGGGGGGGGGAGGGSAGGSSASGGTERIRTQVRDQIQSLRDQATTKARQFADDGKGRATTMLDSLGAVIDDAARAIDERLGSEYSGYAHRAAGAVTGFAGTLRDKDLDELLDDTRTAIRRSPGIAIGIAAFAGFALVRVLKTGLEDTGLSGRSQSGGGQGGGDQSRIAGSGLGIVPAGTSSLGGTGGGLGAPGTGGTGAAGAGSGGLGGTTGGLGSGA